MMRWALGCAALALVGCGAAETVTDAAAEAVETPAVAQDARLSVADTIAHPRRADDAARDQFRNPLETLEFFQVGPDQRVAEIWPGWYTPILAPYLADNDGTYVAVLFPEGVSDRIDARLAAYKETYGDTDTFGTIEYASFWNYEGGAEGEPIGTTLSLPDDSIDRVLTFRNVHSWMRRGYAEGAFSEFYRALKPGGMLGVVAHRLPETQAQDPRASTGYVQQSYMKALAAEVGFEFVASSEVNANPLDTADHPMGVWTLPPASRLPEEGSEAAKDFDADLYKNIGESDRATLLFRKPSE